MGQTQKTFELTEYPADCVSRLWKHPAMWPNSRLGLKKYADSVTNGVATVVYRKEKFGRFYPVDTKRTSATMMWSPARATLFAQTEYDVDIVKCHFNLLRHVVKDILGVCNPHLEHYCANVAEIYESIAVDERALTNYNLKKQDNKTKSDVVKNLFTILLYGGSVKTWCKNFGLKTSDYRLTPFVDELSKTLKTLASVVAENDRYKDLKDFVIKKAKKKERDAVQYHNAHKRDKRKRDEVFEEARVNVSPFKVLSIVLQELECSVVEMAFHFLKTQGVVVTSYNFDGFQVLKKSWGDSMVGQLNAHVQLSYPVVEFIIKPFHAPLDVSQIIESQYVNAAECALIPDLMYQLDYINHFVFMTNQPLAYHVVDRNNDMLVSKSPSDIAGYFQHYRYVSVDTESDPPVEEYDSDEDVPADNKAKPPLPTEESRALILLYMEWLSKRVYQKLVYKPGRPPNANAGDYNSWNGFAIQKHKEGDATADVGLIYEHVRLMSGRVNTDAVYEWLLNWLAWLVQFPGRKTMVCIILFGKQGAGKSCLAENIMKTIMGDDKIFVTANCDKIFGKHSVLGGKHLVVLNEANGKDTKNIHELIKDAITREVTQVEPKNIDTYTVDDYINYILSTNNRSSVDVPSDDRRFMPIHVGEGKIGDKAYFHALRSALNDICVMRAFYKDLMERDLSDWNAERDRPTTELRNDMMAMSISPYQEFYEWMMTIDLQKDERFNGDKANGWYTIGALAFYSLFRDFWSAVGRPISYLPDNKKFGPEMKNLDANVVRFKITNSGNKYLVKCRVATILLG